MVPFEINIILAGVGKNLTTLHANAGILQL